MYTELQCKPFVPVAKRFITEAPVYSEDVDMSTLPPVIDLRTPETLKNQSETPSKMTYSDDQQPVCDNTSESESTHTIGNSIGSDVLSINDPEDDSDELSSNPTTTKEVNENNTHDMQGINGSDTMSELMGINTEHVLYENLCVIGTNCHSADTLTDQSDTVSHVCVGIKPQCTQCT